MYEILKSIEVNLMLLLKRIDAIKVYENYDEVTQELKKVEEKIYELNDVLEIIEAKLEL